ncbi:17254_t:CDS:2, partial [Gigaspora margarita]
RPIVTKVIDTYYILKELFNNAKYSLEEERKVKKVKNNFIKVVQEKNKVKITMLNPCLENGTEVEKENKEKEIEGISTRPEKTLD